MSAQSSRTNRQPVPDGVRHTSKMAATRKSKAQVRRDALAAWWDRPTWPCVILSVDPGREAGAAVYRSWPFGLMLERALEVDTYTDTLEDTVHWAAGLAGKHNLPMVTVLEDWGAGGHRGLAQWIGLGEQRGPWRRAAIMAAEYHPMVTKGRIALVPQTRWRSRVIEETGYRDEDDKFHPFDADGWKAVAVHTAPNLVVDGYVPHGANAAEAVCMGFYAARSDEVGKLIPKTVLKRYGLSYTPLEPAIKTGKWV